MSFFWYLIISLMYTSIILLIFVKNPVHSLILLINVFLIGTFILFSLSVDFFAIIFFMIYIGAIVVLFLFVVIMLDINISSVPQQMRDFLSIKGLLAFFFAIELLIFIDGYHSWDITLIEEALKEKQQVPFTFFVEWLDYFKILNVSNHLESVGMFIYTRSLFAFLLSGFLLLIAMVGAIAVTVDSISTRKIKMQYPGMQTLKTFRVNKFTQEYKKENQI